MLPRFYDEQQYLFLARPVRATGDGAQIDTSETIVESREFTLEQLRSMVQRTSFRMPYACSFCRLWARGLIG